MAPDPPEQKWDGFSIYADVSQDIHQSVSDAIDSYSVVVSAHSEGAKLRPDDAARHKANILGAANRLITELNQEDHRFEDILDDWRGTGDGSPGRISELHDTALTEQYPGWLHRFVLQIHEAAWRLGYLKAGRYESDDPDTPESNGRKMIEDLATNGTSQSDA